MIRDDTMKKIYDGPIKFHGIKLVHSNSKVPGCPFASVLLFPPANCN